MSLEGLAALFQVGGLGLEVVGVLMMANGYLTVAEGRWGKFLLLLDALLRGTGARGADRLQKAGFDLESRILVLRGLSLVGVGFLAQAAGVILAYCS